jgi:hypothetical protein
VLRSSTAWKEGVTLQLLTSTVQTIRRTYTTGALSLPHTSITPGFTRNATSSSFIVDESIELFNMSALQSLSIDTPEVYNLFYRTRTCLNTTENTEYQYTPPGEFHFYALLHPDQTSAATTTSHWIDPALLDSNPEDYPIMIKMHSQNMINITGQTFNSSTMDYEDLFNNLAITPEFATIIQDIIDGNRTPYVRLLWVVEAMYNNYFPTSEEQGVSIGKADGSVGFFGVYLKPKTENSSEFIPTQTYFDYKVLDQDTNILGSLSTVVSKPTFTLEKSSAGVAINLELGELPNPDSELAQIGNTVQIYRRDTNDDNKKLFFDGTITRVRHVYGDDKKMIITLLSRGNEFAKYLASIYGAVPKWDFPLSNDAVSIGFTGGATGGNGQFWFRFYVDKEYIIDSFRGYAKVDASVVPADTDFSLAVAIYNDNGSVSDPSTATLYDQPSVSYKISTDQTGDTIPHMDIFYRTSYNFSLDADAIGTYKWWRFSFTLQDATMDGFLVNPNSYEDDFFIDPIGSTPIAASPYSPAGTVYVKGNVYQTTFVDMDPALMLKAILDGYNQEGGSVWYKPHKITPTGVETTLSFNNQSLASVIQKIIEVCPETFYLVYNITDSTIELLDAADDAEHELYLGTHIDSLEAEVVSDDIINTVFFVGGEQSSGETLYRKYTNQDSIDTYGYSPKMIVDNRVTLDSTADRIANYYLTRQSYPHVRINMVVYSNRRPDNGLNGLKGYPIDEIKVGQLIRIRDLGDEEGTLWDAASWDGSFWDYNFNELGSMYFQVGRIAYEVDYIRIEADSIPADVNASIRDNKRRSDNIDTINTAETPTEV